MNIATFGRPQTPPIAPELTDAGQAYEKPTTILIQKHKLRIVILQQALRAYPSGKEPAGRQQARDINTTATQKATRAIYLRPPC